MLLFIIAGYCLLIGYLLKIFYSRDRLENDYKLKYLNELTFSMIGGILISIAASYKLSISADMPENIELGVLLWILGPIFFGAISILIYLVGLLVSGKLKIIGGISCILFNIGVGIYFHYLTVE